MSEEEVNAIFAQIIDDNFEYIAPPPQDMMFGAYLVVPTESDIFDLLIAILMNTEDGDYGIQP